MSTVRAHAQAYISAQTDIGLRNLRAQLAQARANRNEREVSQIERRIAERERLLQRLNGTGRTRGEAGKENYKAWAERRAAILLVCEREGHDWVNSNERGRYCRRCKLPKELSK